MLTRNILGRIDRNFVISTFKRLLEADSPAGYYPDIHACLGEILGELGYAMEVDNKATAYVRIPGKSGDGVRCIAAHLDTVGLVVRGFNDNGTLRVRGIGTISYSSIEGETCRVHCRDGRVVAGQIICERHSVHVFADARDVVRDETNVSVSIVGDVRCPDDARALGVSEGSLVAIDPHPQVFDNGYIVSRHIDDKAAVAVLLDVLRILKETDAVPAHDTLFAFPMCEEIGHGGSFVPEEVREYVALDIALIGPDYEADEHHVGVITSDSHGPYDWELTNRLIRLASENCERGKWSQQVTYRYTTDASHAYRASHDLKASAFGMACMNTHGRERSHIDALVQTERLALAYLLEG